MGVERTTMMQLEIEVYEEVENRKWELYDSRYPDDTLRDIADGCVPIYNYDRVECLLDDLSLSEPEDSGLVEGVTNIFEILGVSIYERLVQAAYEAWEEVKGEIESNRCQHCDVILDEDHEDKEYCGECEDYYVCKECDERIFPDDDRYDDCEVISGNIVICLDCSENRPKDCLLDCAKYAECDHVGEICEEFEQE